MTTDNPDLPWDHPDLGYAGDDARTASYRKAQSRWRHERLGLAYGRARGRDGKPGKFVGNMLDQPSSGQWLTPEIEEFTRSRLSPPNFPGDADIDQDRLLRNLLSSMPLCFNIFGQLNAHREAAATTLSALLQLPIAEVTEVRVEYAPPAARTRLGDRTAFDAWMVVKTIAGENIFIAVETKYTETFSPTEHWKPSYQSASDSLGSWFKPNTDAIAKKTKTNQLWRNLLLAQIAEQHCLEEGFGRGMVVVISLSDDRHAQGAIDGLVPLMVEPNERLRWIHLDQLTMEARKCAELSSWAEAFGERYLRPVS